MQGGAEQQTSIDHSIARRAALSAKPQARPMSQGWPAFFQLAVR
jgi:hypothetical protein